MKLYDLLTNISKCKLNGIFLFIFIEELTRKDAKNLFVGIYIRRKADV